MATPQLPRFAKFDPSVSVTWDDGSALTGFLLVGLVLPTGYQLGYYAATYPNVPIPTFLKVPINNGSFHAAESICYNADIEPPNSRYVAWYYDSTGQQIAGPTALFSVSSGTCTPPSLTLPTPAIGLIPPVPNSGPTVTSNMPIYYNGGYYVVDYAATLTLDLADALSQECLPNGLPVTLSTPIYTDSTIVPGVVLQYKHNQGGVGGSTLTFGAIFDGVTDQDPDLTAGTYTQYVFQYTTSSRWQLIGTLKGLDNA